MTISLPALVMIGFGLFWLGGAVALWVFAFCTRGGKALSCINCERDAQFCRGCCDAIGPTPSARVVDDAMVRRAQDAYSKQREQKADPRFGVPSGLYRPGADETRAMLEAALSGVSAPVGVEDMMIPAVSPNGSDEDMLKYLDELLAAQGTLMFARGNYNEDQAEGFGVAILDFMRLYGMRLRAKLAAAPTQEKA